MVIMTLFQIKLSRKQVINLSETNTYLVIRNKYSLDMDMDTAKGKGHTVFFAPRQKRGQIMGPGVIHLERPPPSYSGL